jgi:hypothetical protein
VATVATLGCRKPLADTATPAPPEPAPSTVAPPPTPAPAPAPVSHASARPLHDGRVLLSLDADPTWATGPASTIGSTTYHEKWQLESAVDLDALPPELRSFVGMTVDLYGPAGRLCTVVLDTPVLEAHLQMEHLSEPENGSHYADPGPDALWRQLSTEDGAVLLVAGFRADPSCADALWARDAKLPPPIVLTPRDAAAHVSLLDAEVSRALATPAGKKFAASYNAYVADDEWDEAVPWSVILDEAERRVWVDEADVAQVVTLGFGSFAFSPCQWQGPAHAVVRQLGLGVEIFDMVADSLPSPAAVFDADLDGRFELLILQDNGEFQLVHVLSETPALQMRMSLPDNSHVWC